MPNARIVLHHQDARAGNDGIRIRPLHRRMEPDRSFLPAAACAAGRWKPSCPCRAGASQCRLRRPIGGRPKIWLRPRPVPLPTGLVVKKGSKARSITSGVMPQPVSVTSMRNILARADIADLDVAASDTMPAAHRAFLPPSRRAR